MSDLYDIEVYAGGDTVVVRCRLCGGQLSRETPPPPDRHQDENVASGWTLADMVEAMTQHLAGNHS